MSRMDLETSQQIRKLTELVEENNKILRNMQSKARWATFFSIMKWLVFIGFAVGSYFVIQPYLDEVLKLYSKIEGNQSQLQNVSDYLKNIQKSVNFLPK